MILFLITFSKCYAFFCDFKITSGNYTPLEYVLETYIQSLVLYQMRKLA